MRSKSMLAGAVLGVLSICGTRSAHAQETLVERSSQHDLRVVTIADGLDHPWGMAFLPSGDMLVTERSGRLRLIRDGALDPEPVRGLPENITAAGQGGLLDVALHPAFADNGQVYVSYAGRAQGGTGTEVARGRLNGRKLEDVEVIFRVNRKTRGTRHYGSRLLFAPDGTLLITLGDRGRYAEKAQDLSDHLGTVVRVNDDGSVPDDNPFVGQAGVQPEVYSYGNRNVQGIALRPGSEIVWMHEHGPRGGDEVNILKSGANYGWPVITYGIDYSGAIISDKTEAPGMEQPVVYWDPSIAPSGMAFYDGDRFPEWRGDLFVGALAHAHLRRLELDGDRVVEQESLLEDLEERIRDVRSGPNGFLYVLTDSARGRVLRLEPVEL